MKIEIFEKVIKKEHKIWEAGRETDFYKKYNSYLTETKEKAVKVRKENGCPSVEVLRAYNEAKEWKSEKLIIDHFWVNEADMFLQTLEAGNVKEFYLTDDGSGLLGEIHALAKAGWKLEPAEFEHPYYKDYDFETKENKPVIKKALRFFK